jgi:hypothetical protein
VPTALSANQAAARDAFERVLRGRARVAAAEVV